MVATARHVATGYSTGSQVVIATRNGAELPWLLQRLGVAVEPLPPTATHQWDDQLSLNIQWTCNVLYVYIYICMCMYGRLESLYIVCMCVYMYIWSFRIIVQYIIIRDYQCIEAYMITWSVIILCLYIMFENNKHYTYITINNFVMSCTPMHSLQIFAIQETQISCVSSLRAHHDPCCLIIPHLGLCPD